MIGFLLTLLVVGAIAGFLARALVPGRDAMSIPATVALGVVGSFIGGFLASLLFGRQFDLHPSGIIGSVIGAVIALLAYRAISSRSRAGARV